jgi:glycosyltransferase involved in cell wall biosynthesis
LRPSQIMWSAPLYGDSGYAEEARTFIAAVDDYGLPIVARDIGVEVASRQLSVETIARMKEIEGRSLREFFVDVVHFYRPFFSAHERAIGRVWRTMFETNALPLNWIEKANHVDQVWVPSRFNLETFKLAGIEPEKLRVLPQVVDVARWNPVGQRIRNAAPNTCVFLSVFRWHLRKGWDVLIRAYLEEFTCDDDVSLLIKAAPFHTEEQSSAMESPNVMQQLNDTIKRYRVIGREHPDITLHSDWIDSSLMPSFLRGADCYVLPSRGEGWGRPYIEAMASGLPVIATNWGGNLDFMNKKCAFLIDYELRPVTREACIEWPLFTEEMLWAEPDAGHLRHLMREVYEDRARRQAVGLAAREHIVANFSGVGAAKIMETLLANFDFQ